MKAIMMTCAALVVSSAYYATQINDAAGGSHFATTSFSEVGNVLQMGR